MIQQPDSAGLERIQMRDIQNYLQEEEIIKITIDLGND